MSEYSIFPKAIDGYAQLPLTVDRVTSVSAEGINRLRSAIINIENELGILPSGEDSASVSERLDKLSQDLSDLTALVNILVSTAEAWNVVSVSSDYAASSLDFVLVKSNGVTITLPDPEENVKVAIKNVSGFINETFIKTNSLGITIDGDDAFTEPIELTTLYEQINLISDGINWFIY